MRHLAGAEAVAGQELAGELGPFPEYIANREAMLRVVRNHARAARGETSGYEQLAIAPVALDIAAIAQRPRPRSASARWRTRSCALATSSAR